MKISVRQSVLQVLIENYPNVKNHLVHQAHPLHPLSGSQRLRELRKEGIIDYTFDRMTNTYKILTPKDDLLTAYMRLYWDKMKGAA